LCCLTVAELLIYSLFS